MISTVPGFVPIQRVKPTNERYGGATVFTDHYNDFTYTRLMTKFDAKLNTESKRAFERLAHPHGVTITHYHADNGIFKSNKWTTSCEDNQQGLTFAGVNSHHQNGVAERKIRTLQHQATLGGLGIQISYTLRMRALSALLWIRALSTCTSTRKWARCTLRIRALSANVDRALSTCTQMCAIETLI